MLAVTGDFEVDEAARRVHRHFHPVPKRVVPPRPDFDEPAPTAERRGEQKDDMAPAPAVALGWRVPDPADLDAYLPYVVAASALTSGDASRLRRRLVQDDRLVTDVGAHLGLMEDAFDVRNPCAFVIEAHHPGEVTTDRVVIAVDEELDRLATDGMTTEALTRVTARLRYGLLQGSDTCCAAPWPSPPTSSSAAARADPRDARPARAGHGRPGGRRGWSPETPRSRPPRPDRRWCRMSPSTNRR